MATGKHVLLLVLDPEFESLEQTLVHVILIIFSTTNMWNPPVRTRPVTKQTLIEGDSTCNRLDTYGLVRLECFGEYCPTCFG
jgi:hypothetical protein